jgi:hypothetical protein
MAFLPLKSLLLMVATGFAALAIAAVCLKG